MVWQQQETYLHSDSNPSSHSVNYFLYTTYCKYTLFSLVTYKKPQLKEVSVFTVVRGFSIVFYWQADNIKNRNTPNDKL
jgi:hypothetical protein